MPDRFHLVATVLGEISQSCHVNFYISKQGDII